MIVMPSSNGQRPARECTRDGCSRKPTHKIAVDGAVRAELCCTDLEALLDAFDRSDERAAQPGLRTDAVLREPDMAGAQA